MRMGGVASVAVVLLLAACAAPGASPYAAPGVRVEGTAKVLDGGGDGCWGVEFTHDGATVRAPLALPEGYEAREVAMHDPGTGQDVADPALLSPEGDLVGFLNNNIVLKAQYAALDEPRFAADKSRCRWSSLPLVPDEGGVSVDPDGMTYVTRLCSNSSGEDSGPGIDLEDCESSTSTPTPSASVVVP